MRILLTHLQHRCETRSPLGCEESLSIKERRQSVETITHRLVHMGGRIRVTAHKTHELGERHRLTRLPLVSEEVDESEGAIVKGKALRPRFFTHLIERALHVLK